MTLASGSRLGPYEILAPLGAGGMGEVYRARDSRLDRDVAVKVLPPKAASDPSRRHRFEREARAVAALEHPHICVLHDIGSESGVDFLVMELLEGQTLARRLKKGRVARDEALRIGIDIADALDAAHRQGVVHRDLKPANVMLTRSGVKLLDFGLAKLRPAGPAEDGEAAMTADPTSTETGAVLGTVPYMAPEQVEGREADGRSDLWALGAVLYEMLSGRRAFSGTSTASLVAAILRHEPEPLTALDALTPPAIDRTIRRCLAKDPDARWQSARDLADELAWVAGGAGTAQADAGVFRRHVWPWVAATALLATAALGLLIATLAPNRETMTVIRTQLSVVPAEAVGGGQPYGQWIGGQLTSLALSPDGRRLVFVGKHTPSAGAISPPTTLGRGAPRGFTRQLYVRWLAEDRATPIARTEGAENPFFSPDGQWVGYWASESLWKVALSGGAPVRICSMPSPSPFGASWGPDGRIVYGAYTGGLRQVADTGGEPRVLTELGSGEISHRLPHMLPGGEGVVFTVLRRHWVWSDAAVVGQSLRTGERRVLVEGGADARYVPTGHLVFLRLGSLMALPFDAARLRAVGGVVGLEEGIAQAVGLDNDEWDTGAGQFSVSDSGALVYLPGGPRPREQFVLAHVDRSGSVTPLPTPPRYYDYVRLAPGGRRAVVNALEDAGRVLYLADVETGATMLLGEGAGGVWSPDGREVIFGRRKGLYRRTVDGSEPAELIPGAEGSPGSWVSGMAGPAIVRSVPGSSGGYDYDIGQLVLDGSGPTVRPLRATPSGEWAPAVSPDGRWLAYASDESGPMQVYVQSLPDGSSRRQVSTDTGTTPAWSVDGRELFYVAWRPARMMSVRVLESEPLRFSAPRLLFEFSSSELWFGGIPIRGHDVAPDGRGFYAFVRVGQTARAPDVTHVNLVLNWAEELKRRVPPE